MNDADMTTGAYFSACRTWRYALWRHWSPGPSVAFIGLNPSTADEYKNDPTIRRCIRFAQRWGFGRLVMLNIFAFRATDPKDMKRAADPIGPVNDQALRDYYRECEVVVACWGAHGAFLDRGKAVSRALPMMHCLGETKDGHPKHPLYLAANTLKRPFTHYAKATA